MKRDTGKFLLFSVLRVFLPLPALPVPTSADVRVLCTAIVRSSSIPTDINSEPLDPNTMLDTPFLWYLITDRVTPVFASHNTAKNNRNTEKK